MDNEIVEFLIKTANTVAKREQEYKDKKRELGLLKAKMTIKTDWEEALGKSKPTVNEKESYIRMETAELQKEVDELETIKNYCKEILEIHKMAQKY